MVPAIGFGPDSSCGFLQPCSAGNWDFLAFMVDAGGATVFGNASPPRTLQAEGKADGRATAELKAQTIESALGDPLRKWAALECERERLNFFECRIRPEPANKVPTV